METEIKTALNKCLVELVNHAEKLESEKKAFNSAVSEQLKEAKGRINAIGKSIAANDLTYLADAYCEAEIDILINRQ
jgi:uncharacterized protein (UPF0335 family)